MATTGNCSSRRVAYYYDPLVGNYYYGHGHPMKPHRMRMAHSLILNYGLLRLMEYYRPRAATFEEMTVYHSDEYINFLRCVNNDTKNDAIKHSAKFNVGEDCPIFPGIYDFCKISAGGSLSAALKLNRKESDIVINWSGGLHHAKKTEASGFCYVNDIVLAILELLKYHERVLYIDIDVHHGDGVEEAFYTTDRVMTVSFHKYGEYFPGTGDIKDIGYKNGKYYALNFPLKDGMDDESYAFIFRPLIERVIQSFRPSAIILQCGADSLTGDRLGCFNLSINGHAACVEYVKSFNIPLMLVGGGGYTIRNVSRCWAKETAVALGVSVPDSLPYTDYYEYYGPDFKLNIIPSNQPNMNTLEYLEKMKIHLFENLRMIPHAPSIPMIPIPPDALNYNITDEIRDLRINHDRRISIMEPDMRAHRRNEFFDRDSDDEIDPIQATPPRMVDGDIEFIQGDNFYGINHANDNMEEIEMGDDDNYDTNEEDNIDEKDESDSNEILDNHDTENVYIVESLTRKRKTNEDNQDFLHDKQENDELFEISENSITEIKSNLPSSDNSKDRHDLDAPANDSNQGEKDTQHFNDELDDNSNYVDLINTPPTTTITTTYPDNNANISPQNYSPNINDGDITSNINSDIQLNGDDEPTKSSENGTGGDIIHSTTPN